MKDKISDYSATANSNTDIGGVNIDEGCAPSGINDAIRTLMKQLKDFQQGTNSDSFNGPTNGAHNGTVGATTPAAGTFTTLTSTGNTVLGDASTDTLNVGNGGLVKDASGNVGIGTSSPAQKLNVSGSGSIYGLITNTGTGPSNLFLGAANAQTQIISRDGTTGAVPTVFSQGTTESMRIDSSGNVGIGTSLPSAKLEVATAGEALRISGSTTLAYIRSVASGVNQWYMGSGGTAGLQFYTYTATPMTFNVNASEAMRIDSSGNLLVGTTSAGGHVSINSIGGSQGTSLFINGWGSGIGSAAVFTAANTSNSDVMYFNTSAANVGKIAITSTATSYVTSSDYRLKENVAPMTGALAKVAALKPCTYTWKSNGEAGEGFIAHELAEVVPHAVTGEKDEVDADGNPVYQGIDTSFLVATLTAAIKEQQALITSLTERITALEQA
jgi:hypothetical protein